MFDLSGLLADLVIYGVAALCGGLAFFFATGALTARAVGDKALRSRLVVAAIAFAGVALVLWAGAASAQPSLIKESVGVCDYDNPANCLAPDSNGDVGVTVTSGTITLASSAYASAVTLTRTADTNAYTANDVLGAATGSTAALEFTNMGPSGGGEIIITSVSLRRNVTALVSGETSYRLYLYNVTPPSALGDNAAFDIPSGDRSSYLGYIDLGSVVDLGSTLYVEKNIVNKQITLAGTSVFGYLVTDGAYTPASASVAVVTLHAIGL